MSVQSAPVASVIPADRIRWAWHLGALAVAIAAILTLFRYEAVNAVEVWWIYPAYSHCFLIAPIAIWLAWTKRTELSGIVPDIAPGALAALIPVLLGWVVGYFAMINELRQFAVVGMIEIAIVVLLGWRAARILAFPALYLFFLVPFGQYLIPPMQQFATAFTDRSLTLMGIPHYTEGTFIDLPNARFEIAEACAGLRFLIATVALGVLFVHLAYRKWWKIALFLASCIIVPLIANGMRCVGILALAYFTNDAAAVEADHVVYGLGFNLLILLVLLLGGIRFRDPLPALESPMENAGARKPDSVRLMAAAAALLAIIGAAPAFAHWRENAGTGAAQTLAPVALSGWTGAPPSSTWQPEFVPPDRKLQMAVAKDGAEGRVDITVLYYATTRPDHSPTAAANRLWDGQAWQVSGSRVVSADFAASPVPFAEFVLTSPTGTRIVWSTYWVDRRFTASKNLVKLLQLKTMVLGPKGAALIAFSTPVDTDLEAAREKLRSVANAFGTLPSALDAGLTQTALTAH